MKDRMFVVPGSFVPNNDTVTLLNYKRLRNLDLEFDVFALKTKPDQGLLNELSKDPNFNKFNIKYSYDFDKVVPRNKPLNLPISLIYMKKYINDSLKEFEKGNYKYLFTSIAPGISHLCGKRIKEKHPEVIWYASFSDPFKNSPYKKAENEGKSLLYKFIYSVGGYALYNDKYEEAAVLNADKLIFICEEQRDFTLSQYPNSDLLMKKSIIMPLTYIPEWDMYKQLIDLPKKTNNTLQAVHLGRLYGLRKIDSFLQALIELKKEIPNLSDKIVFHQYSEIQDKDVKTIKDNNLEDVFVIHDKVGYDQSINIMKDADVLVLFDTLMPNSNVQPYLPSKIVEYLLLKKPILGICDTNSPSYRILKEYGSNFNGSDIESIKTNILNIINKKYEEPSYSLDGLDVNNYNLLNM